MDYSSHAPGSAGCLALANTVLQYEDAAGVWPADGWLCFSAPQSFSAF